MQPDSAVTQTLRTIVGRADGQKVVAGRSSAPSQMHYFNRSVSHQTADIMHGVVTFNRITSHVFDLLAHESFAEFDGEIDEETEIVIEDCRVNRGVGEAPVNTALFRAGGGKKPGRRTQPRFAGVSRTVGQHKDHRSRGFEPAMNAQLMPRMCDDQRGASV